MAQKGIYLASTDTPFTAYRGTEQGQKRAADQLKSAWEKGVPSPSPPTWTTGTSG